MPVIVEQSTSSSSVDLLEKFLEDNKKVDKIWVPIESFIAGVKCYSIFTDKFLCFVWNNSSGGVVMKDYVKSIHDKTEVDMPMVYIDRSHKNKFQLGMEPELKVTWNTGKTAKGLIRYDLNPIQAS